MTSESHEPLPDLLRCERADHPLAWRVVWIVGAVLCFVAGVVGWLVPVVTGIPFYLAGLVLLAKAVPPVGQRVNAWERRLPLKWRLILRPRLRRDRKRAAEARRQIDEAQAGPTDDEREPSDGAPPTGG